MLSERVRPDRESLLAQEETAVPLHRMGMIPNSRLSGHPRDGMPIRREFFGIPG